MPNNLRYRQIKAFCLAVEAGSFHRASQSLHVTPPSFTLLIKNLEEDLGMRLFERTTRRCEPTPGALAFYQGVSRAMEDMEEAYRHAREEGAGVRGRLTIATVPSLASGILTQVLARFHRRYPGVRIFMSEHRSNDVVDAVRQNQVEIGFGRIQLAQDDLIFLPLCHDRLLVAAPLDHPLLKAPRIRWRDLGEHPLILVGGGATEQQVRGALPGASYAFEVTHLATAVSMARQGLGIVVTPTSAIDGLNVKGLGFAAISEVGATRELGSIHRANRTLSAAAQQFLAAVTEQAPDLVAGWDAHHLGSSTQRRIRPQAGTQGGSARAAKRKAAGA
jgi:DNA-binding transcriptional LysR family regulator